MNTRAREASGDRKRLRRSSAHSCSPCSSKSPAQCDAIENSLQRLTIQVRLQISKAKSATTHYLCCRANRALLPPHPSLSLGAEHYPIRTGISGNPTGIAPSNPGLRVCELPWVHVQIVSQPQRGCGYVRAPMDTTPLGLAHPRRPQGCSFLATLGFVAESLRDSRNYSLEMWIMISPQGEGEVF